MEFEKEEASPEKIAGLENDIIQNSFIDLGFIEEMRALGYMSNMRFGQGKKPDKAIFENKKVRFHYGYNKIEQVYYFSIKNGQEKFSGVIENLVNRGYNTHLSDDGLKTIFTNGNNKYILAREKDGSCVLSYSSKRSKVINELKRLAEYYKDK